MAMTDGIDLSSLSSLFEFATGPCLAQPNITINGEGFEYSAPTPDWATGPCLASPNITINGTGFEYSPPTPDYGGPYTVSSPSRTMAGNGVVRYASARAAVPGDTAQEIGIGFQVDFVANLRRQFVKKPIVFTSRLYGPVIASYLWTFGDGTTSTESNPSHAYNHKGRYTVLLEVWSVGGEYASIAKETYVNVVSRQKIISLM
jgi:PKD repeat protein